MLGYIPRQERAALKKNAPNSPLKVLFLGNNTTLTTLHKRYLASVSI